MLKYYDTKIALCATQTVDSNWIEITSEFNPNATINLDKVQDTLPIQVVTLPNNEIDLNKNVTDLAKGEICGGELKQAEEKTQIIPSSLEMEVDESINLDDETLEEMPKQKTKKIARLPSSSSSSPSEESTPEKSYSKCSSSSSSDDDNLGSISSPQINCEDEFEKLLNEPSGSNMF